MKNLKIGKVKKSTGIPSENRGAISPFSAKLKERLRKLKPGKCFEVTGVTTKADVQGVRSRMESMNKVIKNPYSSVLLGDTLVFTGKKVKKEA